MMVWNFGWFMNVRPRIFISDILDGSDRHNIYLELFLIILECPACLRTSFSLWFKPLSQSNLSFFYLFSLSLSLSLSLFLIYDVWKTYGMHMNMSVCLPAWLPIGWLSRITGLAKKMKKQPQQEKETQKINKSL